MTRRCPYSASFYRFLNEHCSYPWTLVTESKESRVSRSPISIFFISAATRRIQEMLFLVGNFIKYTFITGQGQPRGRLEKSIEREVSQSVGPSDRDIGDETTDTKKRPIIDPLRGRHFKRYAYFF